MSAPSAADIAAVFSAVSSIGQTIIVGIAAIIAYRQLHLWQDQRKRTRMAEVAEQVYVAAHQASDSIKYMRAAFRSYGQKEGETKEQAEWRDMASRWNATNEPFAELKAAQLRSAVVMNNRLIQDAVDRLFEVRFESQFAQEELFQRKHEPYTDQGAHDELKKLRRDAYGSYSARDELGVSQIAALETLARETSRYIGLEEKIST